MAKRILITGASIAGPALAWWLHRFGMDVTVEEWQLRHERDLAHADDLDILGNRGAVRRNIAVHDLPTAVHDSGSAAKRSGGSIFRRPSPSLAVLRDQALPRPISMQCQQTRC